PMLLFLTTPRPPGSTPFPYTTLFRSVLDPRVDSVGVGLQCRARRLVEPVLDALGVAADAERTQEAVVAEGVGAEHLGERAPHDADRKSTRLNSSHVKISYAVFCLKKK